MFEGGIGGNPMLYIFFFVMLSNELWTCMLSLVLSCLTHDTHTHAEFITAGKRREKVFRLFPWTAAGKTRMSEGSHVASAATIDKRDERMRDDNS